MATWHELAWAALRPEARRASAWRARTSCGLLFLIAGAWAAIAPQAALGLGERLRFAGQTTVALSVLMAATAGLRHRSEILSDELLRVSRFQRALGNFATDAVKTLQEIVPAIPIGLFLLSVQAISFNEFAQSLALVAALLCVSLGAHDFRASLVALLAIAVASFMRHRNFFEQSMAALFAAHLALKALLAWSAIAWMRRHRPTLAHEAVTPLDSEDFAKRLRHLKGRRYRWPVATLSALNFSTVYLLTTDIPLPVTTEQRMALGLILVVGALMLIVDARALAWRGLLSGALTHDTRRSFARLFGALIGIPWFAGWAFQALHAGEAFTFNEGAAYFLLWAGLGGALSWTAGSTAKDRLIRELREILGNH